jgi:hypothetical protein
MYRTSNAFSVLQAIAAIAAMAILLWSIGLPSLRFAEAASVTSFSDTLSDSAPLQPSNHTITFVTPSGMAAGETISITFPIGFAGIGSLTPSDLDLAIAGVDQVLAGAPSGATWGVNPVGQVIDIQSGTSTIGAGATVTIQIGTNATFGATGINQITNPATSTSYEIDIEVGTLDTGSTRVAIVNTVLVSASVDTRFEFTVAGVAASTSVNTGDVTGGPTTATTIPFGVLVADTASTAAQTLSVITNAANGFVVTVETDQQLTSANDAVIDGYIDGNYTNTPTLWTTPGGTPGQLNEYGHWGISSSDTTVTGALSNFFTGGDAFVSASTTPVEVFRHNGPTNGTGAGQGTTNVIYKVEITALQEAANDYTATLTYVATPVF